MPGAGAVHHIIGSRLISMRSLGHCGALAAYEQLLTEKNGSTTVASRTRQKIANKGVHQSLVDWTHGKTETNGFALLIEAGLPEFTGEYLVTKYADRFPADVVALARDRLLKHNIQPVRQEGSGAG
jgi:hypothetical protein